MQPSDDDISSRGAMRRGTRAPAAYQRLRELIVNGQFAPGTRIIETDIAARLGVSRTPVRGALQRLRHEGYIVAVGSGRQTRLTVAPLTVPDARELFGIVGQLEALAAAWAAAHTADLRDAIVADLRAANELLDEEIRRGGADHLRLFDADQRFHRALIAAGGGPRLQSLHDAAQPQIERYMRLYISVLADELHRSVSEHAAMIARIVEGDVAGAERTVKEAWTRATRRLAQVIDALGERGAW
jgi:DNA-binding GntR family transcriptional regulator